MLNYLEMTDQQIADFIESHIDEFAPFNVSAYSIMSADFMAVRRFEYGFAVIKHYGTDSPTLWFLFVDKNKRREGRGRQYVKALLLEFSHDMDMKRMTLMCHQSLEHFYRACGFEVESRRGERWSMKWNAPKPLKGCERLLYKQERESANRELAQQGLEIPELLMKSDGPTPKYIAVFRRPRTIELSQHAVEAAGDLLQDIFIVWGTSNRPTPSSFAKMVAKRTQQ